MNCPVCNQIHPAETRFCPNVGLPIPLNHTRNCRKCHYPLDAAWASCPRCGEPLPVNNSKWWIGIAVGVVSLVAGLLLLPGSSLPSFSFQQESDPAPGMPTQTPLAVSGGDSSASPPQQPTLRPASTATPTRVVLPSATPFPTQTPPPTPTNTPTITPSPTASVSSEWMAYAYGEDTGREIYLMNLVTGNRIQVTNNGFLDEAPSFSPDNSQLVFASFRGEGGWELYVIDLQTGQERRITNFNGQARFPQWSPAPGDTRIAFEGREGSSSTARNIWLVDSATGEMERLTDHGADARPSWSPNGAQIAFVRALQDTTGDGAVTTSDSMDIFVLDVNTRQETRLTNTPGNDDFQVAWSTDGRWLLFASIRGDTNGDGFVNLDDLENLYLISPAGGNETFVDLNDLAGFSPGWSSDSNTIIVTASISSGRSQIWMVHLDRDERVQLTETGPFYHAVFSR